MKNKAEWLRIRNPSDSSILGIFFRAKRPMATRVSNSCQRCAGSGLDPRHGSYCDSCQGSGSRAFKRF